MPSRLAAMPPTARLQVLRAAAENPALTTSFEEAQAQPWIGGMPHLRRHSVGPAACQLFWVWRLWGAGARPAPDHSDARTAHQARPNLQPGRQPRDQLDEPRELGNSDRSTRKGS